MSTADWKDVLDVHLHGSFNMSRACAAAFREQNAGAFVHMTSTSGLVGNFGQANYMAAKFGIVGLSRGIALDMQRFNVRSNCIAPFAWTRMIDSIPAQTPEEKARRERQRISVGGGLAWAAFEGLIGAAQEITERGSFGSLGSAARLGAWREPGSGGRT